MATLTELAPTNSAEVVIPAPLGPAPSDGCSNVINSSTTLVLDETQVTDTQSCSDNGHGLQGEFEGLHSYTLCHSRDSREETPVVSVANGKDSSSDEEEEEEGSGSESGLLGGKTREEFSENGELHSSASGDGSSVWSEEGSNEQEPPHYSLLESSGESEFSSPGGTPIPEGPISISSDLNHVNCTTVDHCAPVTDASTMKPQEVVTVPASNDKTITDICPPLPLAPVSDPETANEECHEALVGDGAMAAEGGEPDSMFVVSLVGQSGNNESEMGEGNREEGENGGEVQDEYGVEEESGGEVMEEGKSGVNETEEGESGGEVMEEGKSGVNKGGEGESGGEVTEEGKSGVNETEEGESGGEVTEEGKSGVNKGGEGESGGEVMEEGKSGVNETEEGESGGEVMEGSAEEQKMGGEVKVEETENGERGEEEGNVEDVLTRGEGAGEGETNVQAAAVHVEESVEGADGEEQEGNAEGSEAEEGAVGEETLHQTLTHEVPPIEPEPAPVTNYPPHHTTTSLVLSGAANQLLRSSMMESEDSDNPWLESNLDSSNLDSGVRLPRDSRTNLPILQPLSPDPDLNEQYEYLRRTLSHSRRRYSTRRRRPQRRQNGEGVQRSESSVGARRLMRDVLQNQDSRRVETHVDVHGRTYFMDHDTHTVAYEPGQTQAADISRGMEMLERRYLSLQRSFRGQRPSRFAQPNLSTIPSSPSTPLDLSLSLTRAEAESLSQANSPSSRSQSGTSHSKRKSSRWRFWQRSYRSVSQSRSGSSSDDILPVSPGWEGSPPPAVTETGEVVERRERRERSESREGSVGRSSGGSRSSDATLSGSVAENSEEGEGERPIEGTQQNASVSSEEVQVSSGGGEEMVANGEMGRGREEEERRGAGGDEVFAAAASATGSSRHGSIMRASGMSTTDRSAATRARHKVRATTVRGRHRRRGTDRDTDDETNEAPAQQRVQVASPTPEEREEEVKEQPTSPVTPTAATPLPEELLSSPALRFITRKDLYTFLSSAGDAGEMFLANRGLMELVQRIRTNNNLFSKYQHSRQLVSALNRFADFRADLPQNWEKKLNREGKVFYIDHTHCVTSFIDPRLPLPDHEFTYATPPSTHPSQQPQQLQFGEEAPIRAHHTTVMSSSAPSPPPPTSSPPSVSVTSPQPPPDVEMTYERQVVSFFRHQDIYQRISQRYHRGVRPQLREIIEDVRANGTSALERIQTSGNVAAYELALVLSLFEEDISAINTMVQIVPDQPVREERVTGGPLTASTLQRKKEAFSTKLQNFKVMMARLGFAQSSRLKFNIRRDHLLEDSYEHVMKSDVRHLQRKRLNICFRGEDGLDYGGPSREFFFLLSREVFNPYYGLFEYSANDTYTVQISSTSMFIQNNLDWFRFAGRVMGLVIVQGFLLDVFFTRTIYKALANRAPSLKDLESLEPAFYSSLVWIRENDPEPLDLTFTVEEEAFGELSTHELKEGGMDIPVTDDNKEEYIHLMLRWRLDRGITSQMNMLKKGFSEVMPVSLLQAFDASELEFLTAGTLEIDIDDWKKHTEYRNGYHPTHPVILFFWQAVEMFDNEQRLRLLQFVTGTSSVPFEGFKALRGSNGPKRFTIDFFSDVNSLPRTHTCFNRIDLPPYPSYDVLYHKLLTAIEEGNTFGIE